MTIQIDKGVPLPKRRLPSEPMYPWRSMEIGDSFFVEKRGASMTKQALAAGKASNRKFITRSVEENGVTGIRVWRIA